MVADALSRSPKTEAETEARQLARLTSAARSDWGEQIREENRSDPWLLKLKEQIQQRGKPDYEIKDEILYFRNRFCLGLTSDLRSKVLDELHGSKAGGHFGYLRTLHRVR